MAEKKEFTLEDILAEQRDLREGDPAPAVEQPEETAPESEPSAENAPHSAVSEDTADLNAFATGNIQIVPEMRASAATEEPREEKRVKANKKAEKAEKKK